MEDKIKYSNLVSKKGKNLKVDLLGLSKSEIVKILIKHNLPKFRASQLWNWIYRTGVSDFNQMSNISKDLQRNLSETFFISRPLIVSSKISDDGTIKWLLKLNDGNEIETVWIPDNNRGTLCISSQVGCALDCKFCSTAQQGFSRNLKTSEIIGQVWLANKVLGYFKNKKRIEEYPASQI